MWYHSHSGTEQKPHGPLPPRTKALYVPCLLFVEKLKPPRVTKEQAQAVNDYDKRVIDSVSDERIVLTLLLIIIYIFVIIGMVVACSAHKYK